LIFIDLPSSVVEGSLVTRRARLCQGPPGAGAGRRDDLSSRHRCRLV